MREIKFRAWDKRECEFINIKLFGFLEDGEVWYVQGIDENENEMEPPYFTGENDLVISQFTGLHDKNGREVYEGDIIYFNIDNGVGIEHYQGVVKWADNNPYSRFEYIIEYLDDGFDSLSRASAYNENLEIIGNIYENPELLKEDVK